MLITLPNWQCSPRIGIIVQDSPAESFLLTRLSRGAVEGAPCEDKRGRAIVLGRGKGYAVELNQRLPVLRKSIKGLDRAKQERKTEKRKNNNRNF